MIWLTELANLTEGLYWAREITGEQDLGRGKWRIICIVGEQPFLDGYAIASPTDDVDEPWMAGYGRNAHNSISRFMPHLWEFGPRIDVPSDKERAEFAPGAERMFA